MALTALCLLALVAISQAHVIPSENQPKIHENEPVPIVLPVMYVIDSDNFLKLGESGNADMDDLSKHARGGNFEFGAQRDRWGTDVNIGASGRLWESQNRKSTLDANANWNRHYGGPYGTGPSNYGAGLSFTHRF